MENIIRISRDYSETLGARYISDGEFSGEDFRENFLLPRFKEALKTGDHIVIDFDGGYGNPVSFVEEAFGGLARQYGAETVLKVLNIKNFISYDEPSLIEEVENYINHPHDNEVYLNALKRRNSMNELKQDSAS